VTIQEQIDKINTRDWYTAMRQQAGRIIKAMQENAFTVSSESWIETQVDTVSTRFQLRDINVYIEAGLDTDNKPIYTWLVPIGWVTT
jgi:hypothetical protein